MVKRKIMEEIRELDGANMDIDITTDKNDISWKQDKCPWNVAENTSEHKCAVKNISICQYFRGIKPKDFVFCAYYEK